MPLSPQLASDLTAPFFPPPRANPIRCAPLELAVAKAAAEASYAALALFLILVAVPLATAALPGLGPGWLPAHFGPARDLAAFAAAAGAGAVAPEEWRGIGLAALWCGTATCGYTMWAQSFGQAAVRPAQANLVYTSQPLFSALFAALLLGETLSTQGLVGATAVVAALVLTVINPEEATDKE